MLAYIYLEKCITYSYIYTDIWTAAHAIYQRLSSVIMNNLVAFFANEIKIK